MSGIFTIRRVANQDLEGIYTYSLEHFGLLRAEDYLRELVSAFQSLADSPKLGRDYSHVRPGLYAYLQASHVVYYKPTIEGVDIYRILHKSMDSVRHL